MLAIGRALMSKPKCLMLDEPSLGIAPILVKTIFEKIVEVNKVLGLTILLVEQNANLALKSPATVMCWKPGGSSSRIIPTACGRTQPGAGKLSGWRVAAAPFNNSCPRREPRYILRMELIKKQLTLDYWPESGWFEGRLREIPEVLSQGQTLNELEEHVREDCAELLLDEEYAREHGYAHLDAGGCPATRELKHRGTQPLPGRLRAAAGALAGPRGESFRLYRGPRGPRGARTPRRCGGRRRAANEGSGARARKSGRPTMSRQYTLHRAAGPALSRSITRRS